METASQNQEEQLSSAKSELQTLGSGLQSQAGLEVKRKELIVKQLNELGQTNFGWVERLKLSREKKALLKLYAEKQLEAAEKVLETQNRTISAISDAQLAFVKEALNVLIVTGRSGLQGAASAIFQENALVLNRKLTGLSYEFADVIEGKLKDAEKRSPSVRSMLLEEVSLMMQKWHAEYERILEDFGRILDEKI